MKLVVLIIVGYSVMLQAQTLATYTLLPKADLQLNVTLPTFSSLTTIEKETPIRSIKEELLGKKWDRNYAYQYDNLAFFCKIEVKLEKQTKLPIKFRLGEVNYTERLEGKPYSVFH